MEADPSMSVGVVGDGVSEFGVAGRTTVGGLHIVTGGVVGCATGEVCAVDSIVREVGVQIINAEIGLLDKGGAIGGVFGCADGEGCASPSAELLVGADVLMAPT